MAYPAVNSDDIACVSDQTTRNKIFILIMVG